MHIRRDLVEIELRVVLAGFWPDFHETWPRSQIRCSAPVCEVFLVCECFLLEQKNLGKSFKVQCSVTSDGIRVPLGHMVHSGAIDHVHQSGAGRGPHEREYLTLVISKTLRPQCVVIVAGIRLPFGGSSQDTSVIQIPKFHEFSSRYRKSRPD